VYFDLITLSVCGDVKVRKSKVWLTW